ncbi:Peroxisomal acyl-coenzyme A oxidase 1, partial [Trichoplax sp. H2]
MASPSSDLDRERRKCTFIVAELTDIINGGREKTERRRYLESIILNDPIFGNKDSHFLSREEKYSKGVMKSKRLSEVLKEHNIENPQDYKIMLNVIGESLPIGLHNSMFRPTIRDQGTDEQRKKWLPLANDYKIIGTYAQTELGHGTFIRGLETTSTYDPKREEFVLNTPTLTATKWWPGCLGKTSTHAVVMAQLYIKNQCYGLHSFIVQLRSLK